MEQEEFQRVRIQVDATIFYNGLSKLESARKNLMNLKGDDRFTFGFKKICNETAEFLKSKSEMYFNDIKDVEGEETFEQNIKKIDDLDSMYEVESKDPFNSDLLRIMLKFHSAWSDFQLITVDKGLMSILPHYERVLTYWMNEPTVVDLGFNAQYLPLEDRGRNNFNKVLYNYQLKFKVFNFYDYEQEPTN